MSNAFDAWALPPGVEAPTGPSLSLEGASTQFRYLDANPDCLSRVLDALSESRPGLVDRCADDLCAGLGAVGARLLDPHDELRARALEHLPADSGWA